MSAKAGHIFVSHSSDNRQLASELAAFLEGRGIRVWIAPRDVRPGMDYSEELQIAIENCAAFIVLVTDMANKSPYVRAETEMAFSSHKPIFPVRTSDLQPASGLAFFLKIRHWTDAFGASRVDNLERLVRELQAVSGAAEAASAAAAPPAPAPQAAAAPAMPPPSMPPAPPSPAGTVPPAARVRPTVPPDPEEEEKWRVAVGNNAAYYLDRWRAMEAKGSNFSWNWLACLFNLYWFAYRKMWLPMIGMIAAILVLVVIAAAGEGAAQLASLLSIGISFVTGAFGNHLYRVQTARLVASTSALPRAAQLDALRSRGGVSVPALVVLLAVFGGLFTLAVIGAAIEQAEQQQSDQYNQIYAPPADDADPSGGKPPIDETDPAYYPDGY